MWKYIVKRLLLAIPTLLGVSIIIFGMMYLAPGGPIDVMLGPHAASQEMINSLRAELNLDKPLHVQYFAWLGDVLRGDLGNSWTITQGTAVRELIVNRLPLTTELAILSLTLAVSIGVPAGIVGAVYQDQLADHFTRIAALTGISVPNFWLGIMFIVVFAVEFQFKWAAGGWVPPWQDPVANLQNLLLPTIALGTAVSSLIARMMRSEMLDTLGADYIRTARAMGVPRWRVILTDAVKNAFIPVLTVIGFALAGLMNGAVLTETVFNLPGVGKLLILAIDRRDYRIVQGVILFIAFVYVFVNIIVDVLYAYLDPRIRLGGE